MEGKATRMLKAKAVEKPPKNNTRGRNLQDKSASVINTSALSMDSKPVNKTEEEIRNDTSFK